MLDTDLLTNYIHNFYGHGSWEAPMMFIGPEEGGGTDELEIHSKLTACEMSKSNGLSDLKDFHMKLSASRQRWFTGHGKIQPTWGKLCRIALAYSSPLSAETITAQHVRVYQMHRLGSVQAAETCVIEVSPLPCPDIASWRYDEFSDIPWLLTRTHFAEYFERHVYPNRLARIKDALSTPLPGGHRKIAIVYGKTDRSARFVRDITGKNEPDIRRAVHGGPIDIFTQESFALLWINHPIAFGLKSAYFHSVGQETALLAAG